MYLLFYLLLLAVISDVYILLGYCTFTQSLHNCRADFWERLVGPPLRIGGPTIPLT